MLLLATAVLSFHLWHHDWVKGSQKAATKVKPDGTVVMVIDATHFYDASFQTTDAMGYGTYTVRFRQDTVKSGTVAAAFSYDPHSVTEIDIEQQGNHPGTIDFTTWQTLKHHENTQAKYDSAGEHEIKYVWAPGRIDYYIDGKLVATHTKNVPTQPAPFVFNYWRSHSKNWGGKMTTGGVRRMTVTYFDYQPLS
jgi:endo-1,3-1,4-beta-glycanase ExoK